MKRNNNNNYDYCKKERYSLSYFDRTSKKAAANMVYQLQFDALNDSICVKEHVNWLINEGIKYYIPDPCTWIIKGLRIIDLHLEDKFCNRKILRNIILCKKEFDKLPRHIVMNARSRANPFEALKKGPYMNRGAMKMANLDKVFEKMFTQPEGKLLSSNELLYFADVCGGPGGFSEYIFSVMKWKAKGFGITLKGNNDFQLSNLIPCYSNSFEPFYGEIDDGDIYKAENIDSFKKHIMKSTGSGVHFAMADGGFSVNGQEIMQEILSKRLYLCQALIALSIIREGGHYICKFFDIFTAFSVGIIYILYKTFDKISIHKPNASRPANSERYVICISRKNNVHHFVKYLFTVNDEFNKCNKYEEINEIVPLQILTSDKLFYNYICNSNDTIGNKQINNLLKVLKFSKDKTLNDPRQQFIKNDCLKYWNIPFKSIHKENTSEEAAFQAIKILNNNLSILQTPPTIVNETYKIDDILHSTHNWYISISGCVCSIPSYFLSNGNGKIFEFDYNLKKWIKIDINLHLSPDSLVFGEVINEIVQRDNVEEKQKVFHIIDAHTIDGIAMNKITYSNRYEMLLLYKKSIKQTAGTENIPIRIKQPIKLDCLRSGLRTLLQKVVLKNEISPSMVHVDQYNFFLPWGLFFINDACSTASLNHRKHVDRCKNSVKRNTYEKELVPTFKKDINYFCLGHQKSLIWKLKYSDGKLFENCNFIKYLDQFVEKNKI